MSQHRAHSPVALMTEGMWSFWAVNARRVRKSLPARRIIINLSLSCLSALSRIAITEDQSHKPAVASLKIAQYSNVYGPSNIWRDSKGHFESCSLPCKAIGGYGNSSAAQEADVVIINMQSFSLSSIPWVRSPNQLWVGVYFESMGNYPVRGGEDVLQHFNYTMGYRPDADFPIFAMVYDTFKHYPAVRNLMLPDWESKNRPDRSHLSVWISNCNTETTGRIQILSELTSANITIASYGRCQNTHSVRLENLTRDGQWEELGRKGNGEELVAMASQHLFFYAAENSACAYYITEKVFHGLLAGSVPIYVGDSAHLKAIAPTDSIIYADDFPDTRELGTYMRTLIDNPHAYQKHLAWRDDPRSVDKVQKLLDMVEWERTSPTKFSCALCEFLHHRPHRRDPMADMCI
jgi:hypothetical protein